MTLGIIGTAGRGPDGDAFRANPRLWRSMQAVAQIVVTVLKPDRLVSGGAAMADHLAVQLYLDGSVPDLTLHLPAEWTGHGFKETSSRFDPGRTSNWYHSLFQRDMGVDSLAEIQRAIEKGATIQTGAGGFKERNTDIAREADAMLAFTFGQGAVPKDGGTADTWAKYLDRREQIWEDHTEYVSNLAEAETPCDEQRPQMPAYHYCLNQLKLFNI